MNVARHAIDLALTRTRYDGTAKLIPVFIDGARKNPNNLTLLLSNSLDLAAGSTVVEPGSPELGRGFTLAQEASTALFTLAGAKDWPVSLELGGGGPAVFTTRPDPSLVHGSRWVTAFCLAALRRNTDALDALCKVPTETLRASNTVVPDYVLHTVDALRSLWADPRARGVTARLVLKATEATDPNRLDESGVDWTLHLDVPFLELLFHLNARDPDLNPALGRALELHRKFWSKTGARRRDWDGFLAVRLLGLASLAYDLDVPFAVDSEYLPNSVVTGEAFG